MLKMRTPRLLTVLVLTLFAAAAQAQRPDGDARMRNAGFDRDERRGGSYDDERWGQNAPGDSVRTTDVPVGLKVWRIDERFGHISPAEPDTMMGNFPQKVFTAGPTTRYNTTGNYGAPRMSRVYNGQDDWMMGSQFLFEKPYDYFLITPSELLFTNTKSPFTNLTYMSCGNKTNGEDRITAQFSVNAGKKLGMGFIMDYLYGRGYYQNQSTGHFGTTLYASYRDERYDAHLSYGINYLKNTENGGIESDLYITKPELLPQSFRTNEIPVRLNASCNYLHVNTLHLTHRYNLGNDQLMRVDTIKTKIEDTGRDTIKTMPVMAFVPIASVIHTMRLGHHNRQFVSAARNENYFADFFFDDDKTREKTRNFSLQNTLALEMREGFRPWVKTGMRIYARHDFEHFVLLDKHMLMSTYNENYVNVGAQLMREQGRLFHFNVLGELRTTGARWGEFNVEGWARFNIPLRRDSLSIKALGYIRNEQPSFYYRHYHGRNAWWDNDLSNIFRTRIGGEVSWWKTRLTVHIENISNYTHFAVTTAPGTATDIHKATMPRYGVQVAQAPHSIQTIQATLRQDFSIGPLRWENELTFQKSTDEEHLPLPLFMGYTNLFLKFKIARVLKTELGADARIFTRYHAPDYSPMIGQFATQSADSRTKIGGYPWVNVYVNFHLKRARFFVMYTHVNFTAGNSFLAPHHPTNDRILRFGVSWNFIN